MARSIDGEKHEIEIVKRNKNRASLLQLEESLQKFYLYLVGN